MIIWETVNGELKPKVFCDICGWECQGDDYTEIGVTLILCPNCVKQNFAESVVESENK